MERAGDCSPRGVTHGRWRLLLAGLLAAAVVAGCGRSAPTATDGTATPAPPGAVSTAGSSGALKRGEGIAAGGFPSTRVPPPTDADRPDGPPPTPDDRLPTSALQALLRTAASGKGTCSAAQLRLRLGGIDAALGHRYTTIRATNSSSTACTLVGYPGLGFRGEWGTAFPVAAERSSIELTGIGDEKPNQAVRLAPGQTAVAPLGWTGSLAGAYDEKASATSR